MIYDGFDPEFQANPNFSGDYQYMYLFEYKFSWFLNLIVENSYNKEWILEINSKDQVFSMVVFWGYFNKK